MLVMQNDVTAATSFVEGEVRRLLSGSCEAWEMVMTVRTSVFTLFSLFSCQLQLTASLVLILQCQGHTAAASWSPFVCFAATCTCSLSLFDMSPCCCEDLTLDVFKSGGVC